MASIHFSITADDKNLQKVLNNIQRGIDDTTKKVEDSGVTLDDFFSKMAKGAAAVGLAFSAHHFVQDIVRVRGEFQKLEVALNTMLGSEEKAMALMSELTQIAAITPFGLQEVANGAKQLLAYGVASEKVGDSLVMLGDIAAGLSIPLNDLVYLYGTTMTQGRMFTMDLRQFQGRGIPLADELAKQFGVTKDKVADLVTAGRVGFDEMHKALVALTSEGGKFGGLMKAQSKTIGGQISNIEDAIDVMFNNLGKSQEGMINTTLSGVSLLVENYEKVGKVILGLVAAYGSYRTALIVAAAVEKIKYVSTVGLTTAEKAHYAWLVMVAKAQNVLNKTMLNNPYVLATMAVIGLGTAFVKLLNSSSDVETTFGRINNQANKLKTEQDELTKKFNEYIAVIQDETKTESQKLEAYNALIEVFPQLTGKYDQATLAAMSQAEAQKALNKEFENQQILLNKQQIRESQSRINKLNTDKKVQQNRGNDLAVSQIDKQIAEEKKALQMLLKQQADYRKAKEVEQQKESVKDKKYWETRRTNLQADLDAIDSSKKGTEEWLKIEREIVQVQKEIDKYSTGKVESNIKSTNEKDAENRERVAKIKEYKEQEIEAVKQAQFEIQQAEIDAMKDGTDKTIAQINLDYQRQKAENDRLRKELIKDRAEQMALEWELANPKAVEQGKKFDKSTVSEKDLSDSQKELLAFYDTIAAKEKEVSTLNVNRELLEQYQTYAQKRLEIEEKFSKDRQAMYEDDGRFKEGFSQANIDELNRQRNESLQAVDQEFAMRESQFETWANQVANLSLKKLEELLMQAKQELGKMERDNKMAESMGLKPKYSSEQMLNARAKVATLQGSVNDAKLSPDRRTSKDWKELYETLNDVQSQFEELGDIIGGVTGEIISSAGDVAGSTLSMVNNIVALTDGSIQAIQGTSEAATTALRAVESASVILAIVGAAIKVVTKIVNLATEMHDAKHEKSIKRIQNEVESLEKSYEKLGDAIERAFSTEASRLIGEQNKLLERQKELINEQIKEEDEKKKTDKNRINDWKQQLEDINKTIDENKEKAIDAIHGEDIQSAIENFVEAYADAMSDNEDGWVSLKDTAKEMMKKMVMETIKQSLSGSKAIESLRESLREMYADNIFTQAEQDAIYKMADNIQKELDSKFGWAEDMFKDSESSEQKATYGGFETMSEQTGSELNGRFTALQMAGEDIRVNVIAGLLALNALVSTTDVSNSLLSDILTQHALTNAHLEDLVKYVKTMLGYGSKLDKIVEQTKNL